ncbi:MAG: 4-demethylwyosine synthase TYW1 [Nanobdellota archaeon]
MQINEKQKEELEKQQYRIVGEHSAVKVCGWTKNTITNKGFCYKYKFYGIRSHQCLQMTSSMFCASRCLFCWRGEKAPVSKTWYGPIDKPSFIVDESIKKQKSLLEGFKGNENANKKLVNQMNNTRHVALSLTGEAITYPEINNLLKEFHKKNISTFLVTNAQYPEEIESIENVTQLYLSIDAPDNKLFKKIDRPLFADYEKRIQKSLEALSKKNFRTCIRLTAIKNLNMCNLEGYKNLIEKGNPDFLEVKAYMHVGASKNLLEYENMPMMDEIKEFSKQLNELLENYEIIDEHIPSRVVLLAKKNMKDKQFINFKKFFKINNPESKEYSENTIQDNE